MDCKENFKLKLGSVKYWGKLLCESVWRGDFGLLGTACKREHMRYKKIAMWGSPPSHRYFFMISILVLGRHSAFERI